MTHSAAVKARRFTAEERAIWIAAYGAAFVQEFYELKNATNGSWDRASEITTAEAPATVADMAVERLREWRKDEEPQRGKAAMTPAVKALVKEKDWDRDYPNKKGR